MRTGTTSLLMKSTKRFFAGNDYYTEQSRSDWKGSRTYGHKLIETQDPDGVDAVSGATWTNKKFREIVEMALKEAVK